MPKIKSITIVGGGSAGWMSAATLIANFPNYKISLIESSDIPRIGVGESTQQKIAVWARNIGINHKDFMEKTDASYKFSIRFKDFNHIGDDGFHYPFGNIYLGNTNRGTNEWALKKIKYPETSNSDFADCFFPQMSLINNNTINENKYKIFEDFDFDNEHAYHFDAIKFANWLAEDFAKPKGVNHIIATVLKVNVDENGISSLELDNGDVIKSDLYIDCTGFKSLLIGEALGENFIDYSKGLPCNRAWAVQIPYVDKEKEIQNYTNCTALGYGWVWNTPLYSRIGTGYVYSDKFTTPEDALEEFKKHLRNKIDPVYAPDRITDDLKFNDVKFKTGIHERLWVKNVVAIGLSAGFIEPLESNGLYTVHEFLNVLSKSINKGRYVEADRRGFNHITRRMYESFFQFVQLHYSLSQRDDTDFWKYMTGEDIYIIDKYDSLKEFNKSRMLDAEYTQIGPMCVAYGHGVPPIGSEEVNQYNYVSGEDIETTVSGFIFKTNKSIEKWNQEAKESLSHYEYLKKNFHYLDKEENV